MKCLKNSPRIAAWRAARIIFTSLLFLLGYRRYFKMLQKHPAASCCKIKYLLVNEISREAV
jgi:hypothetical protein